MKWATVKASGSMPGESEKCGILAPLLAVSGKGKCDLRFPSPSSLFWTPSLDVLSHVNARIVIGGLDSTPGMLCLRARSTFACPTGTDHEA